MTTTFRFTKKSITELPSPEKLTTYHDSLSRGLKLTVRPSGTKTFILYRKINGRPERITLGRFPDLSIEQARAKADRYNADIATGKNPADTKRNIRDELTLTQLFQLYLERYAKIHKRSWEKDVEHFRSHCQSLAEYNISHIQYFGQFLVALSGRAVKICLEINNLKLPYGRNSKSYNESNAKYKKTTT